MNPEERVKMVIDLVAEEILRQMREAQEAADEEAKEKSTAARPLSTTSAKNKRKPEASHVGNHI
jgi:hypothetical protein